MCCGDVAGKEDRRAASRALTIMKDDYMSLLLRRTCSTCCSYSGGVCMNRVSSIVPGGHARDPLPNDVCHDYMTQRESNVQDAAIVMFWQRLGIEPQLCLPDD